MAPTQLDQLIQAIARREFIRPPKPFENGDDVATFLEAFSKYSKAMCLKEGDIFFALMNNLSECVKCELLMLPDFKADATDTKWVEENLEQLFGRQKPASPIMDLLSVTQNPGQTVREFISSLRIKAYKIHGKNPPPELESHLMTAFKHGLINRNHSAIIETSNVKTLEEAYKVLKKEKVDKGTEKVNKIEEMEEIRRLDGERSEMVELRQEIRSLKEKVEFLTTLVSTIQKDKEKPYLKNFQKNDRNWQQIRGNNVAKSVECYNCHNSGHIAKYCRQPCCICNSRRHNSSSCPDRRQRQYNNKFERLREIDEFSEDRVSGKQEEFEDKTDEETVYAIRAKKSSEGREKARSGQVKWNNKDRYLNNWVQYINNQGARPKIPKIRDCDNQTLITKRNNERAKNKPIAIVKIQNKFEKVFFDSGAECNIVSKRVFENAQKYSPVRFESFTGCVKCANGSKLDVLGTCWLQVEIGGVVSCHPFRIVENMFPEILVGIKLMKSMKILIKPEEDCIMVNNIKVPFLSKTETENARVRSENEHAPNLRVRRRC